MPTWLFDEETAPSRRPPDLIAGRTCVDQHYGAGADQLPSRAFMAWVAPYLVISTFMKSGSNPVM